MITQTELFPPQPATTRGMSTFMSYDSVNNRIAYTAGKSVIVCSLDPKTTLKHIQFTKHTVAATAAAFSPSGNFIVSGDESGHVIVWDTSVYIAETLENPFAQPLVKADFHVMAGPIKSLAWDGDNSRIIAVGAGKDKFGHCFTWDSGNSVGEIQGHSDTINAVDITHNRPYKAATVGDDKAMVFYAGPPFNFVKSSREHHMSAVRDVKFSPDGKWLVSVGSDRTIVVYDGQTGVYIDKVEGAHKGGISGVSWEPDSRSFVTASADNTVKQWDVKNLAEIRTFSRSPTQSIAQQQVGVVASSSHVMSLSLNGDINIYDLQKSVPTMVLFGHQKPLTKVSKIGDTLVSGGSDGTVFKRAIEDGKVSDDTQIFSQERPHSNYITSIKQFSKDVVTSGWDDKLKLWRDGNLEKSIDLKGQPKGVSVSENIVVLFENRLLVFDKNLVPLSDLELKFTASCIDIMPGGSTVYVTNESNKRVEIFEARTTMTQVSSFPSLRAAPNLVKVSPDGAYLAVAEITGKYTLYSTKDLSAVTTRWAFHSSRVNGAAWTPDSKYLVSGGLDCGIYVYSVEKPSKVLKAHSTHQTGVSDLAWVLYSGGKGSFASVGLDGATKVWDVEF